MLSVDNIAIEYIERSRVRTPTCVPKSRQLYLSAQAARLIDM